MKNDLSEKQFEELREQLREEFLDQGSGYKCKQCGTMVNFQFPLEFLKKNQICSNCWGEDV